MAKAIGIDVGGTNLRVGVFEEHQLLQETRFQADFSAICHTHAPAQAWDKIIAITADGIRNVLHQFPEVQHIGIGFPGFIDPKTQTVAQSPNFPGLKNVNLAQDLASTLQKKVIVENDALAAAYGEYCLADKPTAGLIYLGLGTGLGGGLIYAGTPFSGHHGVAMEAGHIIVEPNGQAGNYLGQMLATVVKVLDVPKVVIGGGMSHAWYLMRDSFEARLDADLIDVLRGKLTVTPSHSHDTAGMLGAAQLALIHI
jgi:glucokinase